MFYNYRYYITIVTLIQSTQKRYLFKAAPYDGMRLRKVIFMLSIEVY